jgi:hypothetical protein
MVVLADEILEAFFQTDLSASFRLEPIPEADLPVPTTGFFGELWSNIATDGNKKLFNKFTDEVGKTIGKHQVIHRPSIGRYTTLAEPKTQESIVSPSVKKSASTTSLGTTATSGTAESTAHTTGSSTQVSSSSDAKSSSSQAASLITPTPTSPHPTMSLVEAANAALMERTAFAIDDAKDEDDEDDLVGEDEGAGGEDDQVLDEVDAFLEAHDSGLTEADQETAKGALFYTR